MSNRRPSAVFVVGTRPEAIKLAPVIIAARRSSSLECVVCSTGQHQEMLTQGLGMFDIEPDTDLGVMRRGQSVSGIASSVMSRIDDWMQRRKPDAVVVQGDTTSALAAAQAAFHLRIPVCHVEAGLRTWNMAEPFPEEMNRVLISRLAVRHCAPTESARQNLLAEGVADESISVTGNTVVDALEMVRERIRSVTPDLPDLPRAVTTGSAPLVLITGHRRENLGPRLADVCEAIRELAARYPQTNFVYPVHLNPSVGDTVYSGLGGIPNVHLIRPVDYEQLLFLMSRSRLIISDSGGIQEEAPSFGKTVLVTRSVTERPEGVKSGFACLVGCDRVRIVDEATRRLDGLPRTSTTVVAPNPYGDGHAADRVVQVLNRLVDGDTTTAKRGEPDEQS